MKKKNGFIAISIIYSFFLCFTMLMGGMLANYAHTKLIVNKINTPLTLNKEAIKPETDPDNPTDPNNPGDGDIYDRFNLHYHTCPTDADNYLCRKIINESNGKEYTKDYLTSLPRDYLKDFGVGKAVFNKDSEYSPYIYYGSPYSIFQHYKKVSGYNFKNYVWFAGRKWKILRINTDGSIRIMLDSFNAENPDYQQDLYNLYNLNVPYQNSGVAAEDGYKYIVSDDKCTKENPCKSIIYYNNGDEYYSTYSNYNSKNYSQIKDYLETWYGMCIAKQYPDYTTFSVYCNSKKTTDDLSLYKSDFGDIADNCEKEGGRVYYLNVGLISYDELYYAAGGTKTWVETDNLYVPFYPVLTMTGYNESMIYLTPSIVDEMGEKTYQGRIDFNYYTYATNKNFTDFPTLDGSIHPKIYPVINLVYNVKVSGGDGTYDNPYKVVILI